MFTATLKKVCTKVTHTPETPQESLYKSDAHSWNSTRLQIKDREGHQTRGATSPKEWGHETKEVTGPKSESSRATQDKQSKQTDEPVIPKTKWNKDSIELNSKVHKLPITKEYILKEYSDVFKGIGTLPGGPYHIRLKEQYRPVQHPLPPGQYQLPCRMHTKQN